MMRPQFLAALLLIAGCAMPPETSAPNAAGDERPVEHREVLAAAPAAFVCASQEGIMQVAEADMASDEMMVGTVRQFSIIGLCRVFPQMVPAPLTEKLLEYTDAAGRPSEVWRVGDGDVYTLVMGKPTEGA